MPGSLFAATYLLLFWTNNVFMLHTIVFVCEQKGDKGDQGRVGIAGMPGLPGTPVSNHVADPSFKHF